MQAEKVKFTNLKADDFQHPWDVKAMNLLKQAKGFDTLMAKVMEYGYERYFEIENVASNIQITHKQCSTIFDMARQAADTLGVQIPKIYLDMNPVPNAFTYGQKHPFILITHSIIDLLEDDELFYVIAHEMGHIKCNHVLYTMVADNLGSILQILGQATLGLGALIGQGINLLFLDWRRKAELSADRAGLLATQNIDIGTRVLMKLAGGSSPKIAAQLDKDTFIEQVKDFDMLDSSTLSQLYKIIQSAQIDHPWPVLRASELKIWHDTEYKDLINHHMFKTTTSKYSFCSECGAKLVEGYKFCQNCGKSV